MKLQVIGKNIEISEAVERRIRSKIGKLTRYLPNATEAKVEIHQQETKSPQHRFTVQVTLNSKGTLLRGEQKGEDIYEAADRVAEVLARQIERYKGKLYEKGRGISLARQGVAVEEIETPQRVVKVKRFAVKSMSLDEATEQMELLGHDFFLFINADTNELKLLYRRKDGGYGLIEPELA